MKVSSTSMFAVVESHEPSYLPLGCMLKTWQKQLISISRLWKGGVELRARCSFRKRRKGLFVRRRKDLRLPLPSHNFLRQTSAMILVYANDIILELMVTDLPSLLRLCRNSWKKSGMVYLKSSRNFYKTLKRSMMRSLHLMPHLMSASTIKGRISKS